MLDVIPFGKHKGRRWEEIPNAYLTWLVEESGITNNVYRAARAELQRRQHPPADHETDAGRWELCTDCGIMYRSLACTRCGKAEAEPVEESGVRYTVIVEDAGHQDATALPHRLRAWLKQGLRQHGIRCVRVEESEPCQVP